jgi:MFS family permease
MTAVELCHGLHQGKVVKDMTIMRRFQDKGKSYTNVQNNALYSVYNFENIILATMGGMFVDWMGLRVASLVFQCFVLTGQALASVGIYTTCYPLIVLGRLCYGVGGESLSVADSTFCSRWFTKIRLVAIAMATTLTIGRIGSFALFNVAPRIADSPSLGVTWSALIGVIVCVVSIAGTVLLVAADKWGASKGYCCDIGGSESSAPAPAPKEETVQSDEKEPLVAKEAPKKQSFFKDLAFLATCPPYILVVLICVFTYGAVFPFNSIAKVSFQYKFQVSQSTADTWTSLYIFMSAFFSPLAGIICDMYGFSVVIVAISCAGIMLSHLLLLVSCAPAILVMCIFGCFVSFMAAGLWPIVPRVLPESVVGTGFGIMMGVQNLGLGLVPIILGLMDDHFEAGKATQLKSIILMAIASVGLLCAILLQFYDTVKNHNALNKPMHSAKEGLVASSSVPTLVASHSNPALKQAIYGADVLGDAGGPDYS